MCFAPAEAAWNLINLMSPEGWLCLKTTSVRLQEKQKMFNKMQNICGSRAQQTSFVGSSFLLEADGSEPHWVHRLQHPTIKSTTELLLLWATNKYCTVDLWRFWHCFIYWFFSVCCSPSVLGYHFFSGCFLSIQINISEYLSISQR